MEEISGKVALVTGANRGIGRAIALGLAQIGLDVGVHFLSDEEKAESVCARIRELGRQAVKIQADVSQAANITRMAKTIEQELGTIQVLVNNAGIAHQGKLEDLTEAEWDRIMAVNLKSAFLLTQACLAGMREKKWGRIINISSVAAQTGGVTSPLYVTSKAGLIGLTHSYAAILIKEGITANAIAPALIDTDMVRELGAKPEKIPVGRFGTPGRSRPGRGNADPKRIYHRPDPQRQWRMVLQLGNLFAAPYFESSNFLKSF